ncbi:hypothetical protein B0H13DRAFT_2326591 [Mycena leptocephala]|nr:hypothetical protein B0H13DRAFT_2326591 [Mycena leptocephala]
MLAPPRSPFAAPAQNHRPHTPFHGAPTREEAVCTFAAHSTRFATPQRRLDRACHAVFLFLLPASATFLALALGLTPAGKAGFSSPLELLFFFSRGRVRVARPLPPSFTQPFMHAIVRSGAGCAESATLNLFEADAARLSCHLLLAVGIHHWYYRLEVVSDHYPGRDGRDHDRVHGSFPSLTFEMACTDHCGGTPHSRCPRRS